jgi:hypothetical protein
LLLKRAQDANLIITGILSGAKYQGMHIELVGAAAVAVVAALAIVAKLTAQRQRSWLERDLQRGDLSFLTDFAFFRNRRPPSIVVDRLSDRGFLAKTERGSPRMTPKGWIAILLRRTSAKSLK